MKEFNAVALFRLSVLGPLVSRDHLERGELQTIILKRAVEFAMQVPTDNPAAAIGIP
jgi:hypothetical protein